MQNLKNYEIFFHPVFWLKLKLGINMTCVWGKATGINGSWLLNVSNRFQKWNPPNLLHPLGRNFLVAWLSFQNSVLQGSCGTVSWQVGPGYQPSLSHENCWLFRCWSSLSGWSSCGASPSTSTSTTPATPSGWWTPASWTPTDAGRGGTGGGETWSLLETQHRHSWFTAMYQSNKHKSVYQTGTGGGRTLHCFT